MNWRIWFLTAAACVGLVPAVLTGADQPDATSPADEAAQFAALQQRFGRGRFEAGVYKSRITPHWLDDGFGEPSYAGGTRFWYRNDLAGGRREYILVDAEKGTRQPAFDHPRLAAALSEALAQPVDAERLSLESLQLADEPPRITFRSGDQFWRCQLSDYTLAKVDSADAPATRDDAPAFDGPRASTRTGEEMTLTFINQTAERVELFWLDARGNRRSYGQLAAGQQKEQRTYAGHVWEIQNAAGQAIAIVQADPTSSEARITGSQEQVPQRRRPRRSRQPPRDTSPDGNWTAFIRDHNVFLRSNDDEQEIQLTTDGREGLAYQSPQWSGDSQRLVAFLVEPGEEKEVYLVESSPAGGGRARLRTRAYALPGDKFSSYQLRLFDVEQRTAIPCQIEPIDLGRPVVRWNVDGHRLTVEKIDRGHQRFRLIEVDTRSGATRNLIDEQTDTFIWTAHTEGLDLARVNWLQESDEILYVSERDGWRHLYLVDVEQGGIKNQITRGEYVVRGIDRIDEQNRQVWFRASGMNPGQDPYLIHYYRIDFDGENLVALTDGDGNHSIQYSPNRDYLIDTYSRVDLPPVHELRRVVDGQLICHLETADISQLQASSWQAPEVFVAKGRDGKTDIWGIICRPRDLDPATKYPIIEDIYAGPQGSFVPKTFSSRDRYRALNELGFVVVKIDGMGTANRSKAFHDVCWQNLKDAGLEDRILWIKAAAAKYPYLDIDRVGIYGTSAGGQNAAAAVLFHPEFYKAAVANCGCHDNRMDKASWNEQWMGYPVGPWYSASSNIDNAHRLQGHLFLIVGEMDTNVPPESTMRFADALIKAGKDFDLLVVPGGGHGAGGAYGQRRMHDFFVRHLLQRRPPDHNAVAATARSATDEASERPGTAAQRMADARERTADSTNRQPPLLDLSQPAEEPNRLARITARFRADQDSLRRFYSIPEAPSTQHRLTKFYREWLAALSALPDATLSDQEQEELNELKESIERSLTRLPQVAQQLKQIEPLVPFASAVIQLDEDRRQIKPVDARQAADIVDRIGQQVEQLRTTLPMRLESDDDRPEPASIRDAAESVRDMRSYLARWYRFYHGYDPTFTWWLRAPYEKADGELEKYAALLTEHVADGDDSDESQDDAPDQVNDRANSDRANPTGGESNQPSDAAVDVAAGTIGNDVPALEPLLTRPQGRMEAVIERFGQSQRGRRGRGGRFRRPSAASDRSASDRSATDRSDNDRSEGNRSDNDRSEGDRSDGDRSDGDRSDGDRSESDRSENDRSENDRSENDRSESDRSEGERSESDRTEVDQRRTGANARPAQDGGDGDEADQRRDDGSSRRQQLQQACLDALEQMTQLGFDEFSVADRVDYLMLRNELEYRLARLDDEPPGPALPADESGISGRPIGREALMRELRHEMIPYTPEELIEIALREYSWCESELKKASREMGLGDNWSAAVEKVKTMHVAPGQQPVLIRDLAWEAIDYLRQEDLVTVPPLAAETWRMAMMSPERQLVNPFFTGGTTITVSFPTDTMSHQDKLQSLRGNNIPFARATVHHELIPGHNLQAFMNSRHCTYRRMFSTPFWGEGWALYWEMLLYERGFAKAPEDRIGFLVWRSHRCARIVFSLSFHLGQMSPQQCIDYLVARVGFERNNAAAEVRRSFQGNYSPLYQAAYMLGGLQFRALHRELVGSGKMSDREFHDTILHENSMPIEMVRLILTDQTIPRDYQPSWRFAD